MTFHPPQGWELRPNQVPVLEKIAAAFAAGKKIVAVQGPTGSGKSLIGVTAAGAFEKSYYLVPLKTLQDQIWADFEDGETLKMFKGKVNYNCTQTEHTHKVPVSDAHCQGWNGRDQIAKCKEFNLCPYYNALLAAKKAEITLMNFSLYLCWMRVGQKMDSPPFVKRDLHVIDEAHKIEDFIRDFLTIELNEYQTMKHLNFKLPEFHLKNESQFTHLLNQIRQVNLSKLAMYMREFKVPDLESLRQKSYEFEAVKELVDYNLNLEDKLEHFENAKDNYAFGYEERYHALAKKLIPFIIIKPLKVGGFIRENVLGEQTLLLSATLPKQAVLSMGFEESEIEYIEMDSTFPVENRPIYVKVVGAFNKGNVESLIPKLRDAVSELMDKYAEHKGIIHAPSYRMAQHLEKAMRGYPGHERLLLQPQESGGAMKIMELHKRSPEPTVLLSPGMKEGVDLKDDLARFQLVLKCPYPNLGDPAVAKLAKDNYFWYLTKTIIDFTQMYGRPVRTPTDWAHTYILDENLRSILRNNSRLVPKYVKEAMVWK